MIQLIKSRLNKKFCQLKTLVKCEHCFLLNYQFGLVINLV